MDQSNFSVSLHTANSIGMRRGFRLVAGLGLFPAVPCRQHRRARLGGTAASGVDGRTAKYEEDAKRQDMGQSACPADGAECSFSSGHCGRAGPPL